MKTFQETEFVIFDVETTGLSPGMGDRVIEVAALKVKNLEPVEEFHSFVNPGREISPGAFMVNGITTEMLAGSPRIERVLPRLLNFLANTVIVGHNIKFDLGFLNHEVRIAGIPWDKEWKTICTIKMARSLLPGLGRYPLWLVARRLGVEARQEHRALADVYLTLSVFRRLVEIAEKKSVIPGCLPAGRHSGGDNFRPSSNHE